MGGRPGTELGDVGGAMRRQMEMGEHLRAKGAPREEAGPGMMQRMMTPAPWEQRANAWLRDVLRRASTPAPWEQRANAALLRMLRGG